MKAKQSKNLNAKIPYAMLAVSLAGFGFFYLVPFLLSFSYSMRDNPVSGQFCGLRNYRELFRNVYFLRGLKNTAIFVAVSIPLNIVLSLGTALAVKSRKHSQDLFSLVFLIPLAVPSATSAFFWENFFGLHGTLNRFLSVFHVEAVDWLEGKYGMMIIVIIFIWKNIGYDMALFISGMGSIPEEYYECADTEGAGGFWKFRHITLTYLTPTMFLALIMTFVNSFKVFREIYIITGEYPPESLYVLQHYMNNMFLSLNYSRLVSAVYILTAAIVLMVACMLCMERKISENLHF